MSAGGWLAAALTVVTGIGLGAFLRRASTPATSPPPSSNDNGDPVPVTFGDLGPIAFVPAKYYRPGRPGPIRWIVMHDAECAEVAHAARNVAAYFADPRDATGNARIVSAHYTVDNAEAVQCVADGDTAFAAMSPANEYGLHIELAGFARQTPAEWADGYSEAELRIAAQLVARLASLYSIPLRWVDAAGLVRGDRGITTHAAVSDAWHKTDHRDPGPNFPYAHFLDLVQAAARAQKGASA